jgi:hypothetical protein
MVHHNATHHTNRISAYTSHTRRPQPSPSNRILQALLLLLTALHLQGPAQYSTAAHLMFSTESSSISVISAACSLVPSIT